LKDEGQPFCEATQSVLKDYQLLLGLRDADIQGIEREILSAKSVINAILQDLKLTAVKPDVELNSFNDFQEDQDSEDELISERDVDYARLRDLLKAGRWREADREMCDVMMEIIGDLNVVSAYYTTFEKKILKFPYSDLQTIDRLWVKYSGGRFGFSIQMRIYLDCGGGLDGEQQDWEIWEMFCERLGWRENEKDIIYRCLQFDPQFSAPGELPLFFFRHLQMNRYSFQGQIRDFWLALVSYKDL
jgi:GUN4-like